MFVLLNLLEVIYLKRNYLSNLFNHKKQSQNFSNLCMKAYENIKCQFQNVRLFEIIMLINN